MLLRRTAVAVALVCGLVLPACSSSKAKYGSATQRVFLEACNPARDDTRTPICQCAYDRITKAYTYDQYVELDKSLQNDPKAAPEQIAAMITACAVETSEASASSSSSSS
jgi:hypothetical protein